MLEIAYGTGADTTPAEIGAFYRRLNHDTAAEPDKISRMVDVSRAFAGYVLEHEMAHYLARFRNRTFSTAGVPRSYDDNEHSGESLERHDYQLLEEGFPYKLFLFGRNDQSGTEKFEIYDRLHSGNWSNP